MQTHVDEALRDRFMGMHTHMTKLLSGTSVGMKILSDEALKCIPIGTQTYVGRINYVRGNVCVTCCDMYLWRSCV